MVALEVFWSSVIPVGSLKAYAVLFIADQRRQPAAKRLSPSKVPLARKRTSLRGTGDKWKRSCAQPSCWTKDRLLAWASRIEAGLQPARAWIAGHPGRCPGLCWATPLASGAFKANGLLHRSPAQRAGSDGKKEIPQAESLPQNFGRESSALNDATHHTIIAEDSIIR